MAGIHDDVEFMSLPSDDSSDDYNVDAINCDTCSKENLQGLRYKCLICIELDMCSACFEMGARTPRHMPDHPIQCIVPPMYLGEFYGGDQASVIGQKSFSCPYCSIIGFTDFALLKHIRAEHADTAFDVLCPVCITVGNNNVISSNIAGHLADAHCHGGDEVDIGGDEVGSGVDGVVTGGDEVGRDGSGGGPSHQKHQFLLSSNIEQPFNEEEEEILEQFRANRSLFVQEILFATLTTSFNKSSSTSITNNSTIYRLNTSGMKLQALPTIDEEEPYIEDEAN